MEPVPPTAAELNPSPQVATAIGHRPPPGRLLVAPSERLGGVSSHCRIGRFAVARVRSAARRLRERRGSQSRARRRFLLVRCTSVSALCADGSSSGECESGWHLAPYGCWSSKASNVTVVTRALAGSRVRESSMFAPRRHAATWERTSWRSGPSSAPPSSPRERSESRDRSKAVGRGAASSPRSHAASAPSRSPRSFAGGRRARRGHAGALCARDCGLGLCARRHAQGRADDDQPEGRDLPHDGFLPQSQ